MRIGVIGTGNIGGMLANAYAACAATKVYVYNRTMSKAYALADSHENIVALQSWRDVVKETDAVFLCTKPADAMPLLMELGPTLSRNQYLIPTISALPLCEVESYTNAGVAKVIPSILQCLRTGVLLLTYGPSLSADQQLYLRELLGWISTPYVVADSQIRVASDLTSCGPAFLAHLVTEWAEAAERTGKLAYTEAEHLLTMTLTGFAHLLQSGMTMQDIIAKVSVPGGVTEAGIASLQQTAPHLFDDLHYATAHHRHHPAPVVNVSPR